MHLKKNETQTLLVSKSRKLEEIVENIIINIQKIVINQTQKC